MKLALAQIDMRLGDIEGICGRIEDQARLAHERGARVLCGYLLDRLEKRELRRLLFCATGALLSPP